MGKTSNAVKDKWNAANYDRLMIRVPAGCKAKVEAAALAAGESVNMYTQKALLQRMGIDAWTETDAEEQQ